MINKIVKRNKEVVPFDPSKIERAIKLSFKDTVYSATEQEIAHMCDEVIEVLEVKQSEDPRYIPSVEQVQDIVERTLIANNFATAAKEYILYRAKRNKQREMQAGLMKDLAEITYAKVKDSELLRDNANIDGASSMGTMLKYGTVTSTHFNLDQVIPEKYSLRHQCGDIHIHDLEFYSLTETCCQIDIKKLLARGFNTGHGFIRPPQSIRSYSALACIAIQSNQNDMHGGQSIPNFDFGMAPGVRLSYMKQLRDSVRVYLEIESMFTQAALDKIDVDLKAALNKLYQEYCEVAGQSDTFVGTDRIRQTVLDVLGLAIGKKNSQAYFKLINRCCKFAMERALKKTEEETQQACEAFIHNLCSMHSRAGAQVPFSSINFGTDTSLEGRMTIRGILQATWNGLGGGETPIFPISIFKLRTGVNYLPTDPNYDLFMLACEVSAKRMFPNFVNLDAPFNAQYYKEGDYNTEVAQMGCRTRVIGNRNKDAEVTGGRGNLSFTSINLPRLGIIARGDWTRFYELLDERLELVKDQLLHRFRIQCARHVYNYPFLMGQGIWLDSEKLKRTDTIAEVLKHGTLSIGFIGLAETLFAMTGAHHGESEAAQKKGLEIVEHMRNYADAQSEKYDLNFTLIATPAEGLSGRFLRIDQQHYGIIAGITDKDYYTNSSHVPVYYDISAAEKIKIEAPYHALENAGHICYVEMNGDPLKNIDSFVEVVKYMHDCGVGYGAINHPIDRDPVCGYNGIIDNECPGCHRHEGTDGEPGFERIRRITGYLVGTLDRFNSAKKSEEHDRIKHF